MALQDTATALSELETAILIRPDDPLVLIYDGNLLVSTGRIADGEKRIREALRADSDYALPQSFSASRRKPARHDHGARRIHGISRSRAAKGGGARMGEDSNSGCSRLPDAAVAAAGRQSERRATTGSTREARHAGAALASIATRNERAAAAPRSNTLVGAMP